VAGQPSSSRLSEDQWTTHAFAPIVA
jgi:hypothetical protein